MPMPEWRPRPNERKNATVLRYGKADVQVVFVAPPTGPNLVLSKAPWGPWIVEEHTRPKGDPDLEAARVTYLANHPCPPPERRTAFARLLEETEEFP